MSIKPGNKVKKFSLPATGEQTISLAELSDKNVVLYFYPKDSTPGCTQEGLDFQANGLKFARQNTIVLGVSRDSVKSHENFRQKQGFKFDLIADEEELLCNMFDVIKIKICTVKKSVVLSAVLFLLTKVALWWKNGAK